MPDLMRIHHPRVVAGPLRPVLDADAAPADEANRRVLARKHATFAVLLENASERVWREASTLAPLGIVPVPLPRREERVEPYLLAGVPGDLEPGLSPLTDLLRQVIERYTRTAYAWLKPDRPPLVGTRVMGVLNVTPDSFSDGGRFFDADAARRHALDMVEAGADLIDVGGCSTRPGATGPDLNEELRRTVPVIEAIRKKSDVVLSIDTWRAEVAKEALNAGADVINDVTALSGDPAMAALAAARRCPVVLMHMQGTFETMQTDPHYDDPMAEIYRALDEAVNRAEDAGIARDRIAVDPGFGFGKTVRHNLEILRRLTEFRSLGCPVLIGTSRKSTLGKVLDREADGRLAGTAATVALSVAAGAAIVRVHDVAEMRDVVRMTEAVLNDGAGQKA